MQPIWQPQAVVFDLDGVLIDSEPAFRQAATELVNARGREILHTTLDAMMGCPAVRALHLLKETHGLVDSIEELREEAGRRFFSIIGENAVPLLRGSISLVHALSKLGLPIAIATSSSRRYVHRILESHPDLNRFGFELTADDVREGKPSPEIYQKAAQMLNLNPSAILVLEDSPNGMSAALAAGCRCGVVPHALVPRHAIEMASFHFHSLEDEKLWRLVGL